MSLDVVVYLLRANASLDDVRDRLTDELGYRELPQLGTAEAAADSDSTPAKPRMLLLAKQHDEKHAGWVEWCGDAFDVSTAPVSSATGAVLLVEAGGRVEDGVEIEPDRVFAVTFGTGWNALPRGLVEPDFGLRVAMQLVPPNRIQSLVTRSLDLKSSEKNVYTHAGSDLAQFPLDAESEWLRETGGVVDHEVHGFAAVTGKTSIRLVSYRGEVAQLRDTCVMLLARFNAAIPEAFRFVENLVPLSKSDARHQELELELLERVGARQFEGLAVVLAREDAERAYKRELKHGHRTVELGLVSDEEVWNAIGDHAAAVEDFNPKRLTLRLVDENDVEILRKPILQFIQAELPDPGGDVWLRIEGRWFRANRDYVEDVDRLLAEEVPDLTNALSLPPWDTATHRTEGEYNEFAATQKQWLLQDRQNIYRQGQAAEPCDILTADRHFIHLKNADSGQSVGAQVGQLRGAAYLLKNDDPFREEMAQRYLDHVGSNDLLAGRATFVLALARKPQLPLYGNMLVAKINILDCARKVRALGHEFAACKVDRT